MNNSSNTETNQIVYPIKPNFLFKEKEYVGYSVISLYQNKTHYNGHYIKYINKFNELLESDTKLKKIYNLIQKNYSSNTLEETRMLLLMSGINLFTHDTPIYRNASQIYNHDLYWNTITTIDNSSISFEKLKSKLFSSDKEIGKFYFKFLDEGTKHFGSGWEWIFISNGKLDVFTTHDSKVPIDTDNVKIIGVIDLWEHAYYLDYQSDRKKYLEETWKVLDWAKFII